MRPPVWAVTLTAETCARFGVGPPRLTWKRRDAGSSSGTYTRSGEIVVRAGRNKTDQRMVLLHEIAHHLAPAGTHHGETFWRIAWGLFRRHRLSAYALIREGNYRVASLRVARQLGVPRAREAARQIAAKPKQRRGICPMPADEAESQGYRTPHTHYLTTVHYYHGPDRTVAYSPGDRP